MVETVYVVEEDEDEEEVVRVEESASAFRTHIANTVPLADGPQEIRDAVCSRYVTLLLPWACCGCALQD